MTPLPNASINKGKFMNSTAQNDGFAKFDAEMTFRLPLVEAASTRDAGKVRLGGFGPVFRPAAISDAGKVRVGGFGPLFR